MRSQDALTLLQHQLKWQGNIFASGRQFEGTYYGVVVQTDVSTGDGAITAGNMTITIPNLSGTQVWGPLPYPGTSAPPIGTTCSLTFNINNTPIVHSFIGFGGAQGPQGPQGVGGTNAYWGGFYDTTSQTGSTSSVNLVAIHNTAFGNGMTLLNPGSTTFGTNAATAGSAVQINNAGNYTLTYQVMFANSGTQIANADLWIRLNGVDVPTTNIYTTITGSHAGTNGTAFATATFNLPASVGDYYQLCWAPSSSNVSILSLIHI